MNKLLSIVPLLLEDELNQSISIVPIVVKHEDDFVFEETESVDTVVNCACLSSCGGNFSHNGSCSCLSSCGSNMSH